MKAGQIFITTHGEYSDYGIGGTWRALQDFDLDKSLASFVSEYRVTEVPTIEAQYFDKQKFQEYLLSSGLIEAVHLPSVHLGDYGEHPKKLEPEEVEVQQWVRACFDHTDCAEHPELGAACAAGPKTCSGGCVLWRPVGQGLDQCTRCGQRRDHEVGEL